LQAGSREGRCGGVPQIEPLGAYGAIPKSSGAAKTQPWEKGSAMNVAVAVPVEAVATAAGGGLLHHAFP